MGKIYKGGELIKAIADGEIKNEAKIIPHYPNNDCIVKYFEYFYGFLKAYYKQGKRSDENVNVCVFLDNDRTFEVMENETDIKIDSIEELNDTCYDVNIMSDDDLELYHNETRTTINKILQAVKQIDKRVKKLEGK